MNQLNFEGKCSIARENWNPKLSEIAKMAGNCCNMVGDCVLSYFFLLIHLFNDLKFVAITICVKLIA